MSGLWIIWGVGFGTGAMATYLGCILFCRRILKEEGELVRYLAGNQAKELDDAALNSFLKAWSQHMEGYEVGKYSRDLSNGIEGDN
jgi:hypothetical protein